jgi:hypothetical protein
MISACIQQLTTTSLSSSAGTRHWSCTSCSTGGRAKSLSQNITPSRWPCGICPPRSNVSLQSHSILPTVASSQTRECDWRIDQSRRQQRTESGKTGRSLPWPAPAGNSCSRRSCSGRMEGIVAVNMGWPCWAGVVAEDLDAQRRFYRDVLGWPNWLPARAGSSSISAKGVCPGSSGAAPSLSTTRPATRLSMRSPTSNPRAASLSLAAGSRSPGSKGTIRLAAAGAISATPKATSSRSRNATGSGHNETCEAQPRSRRHDSASGIVSAGRARSSTW